MPEHIVNMSFSNSGTRNEVRMRVVRQFATETPGTGKDDNASRYTYYVETLSNGDRVYLRRPANLHNGFDFLVCVENQNFSEPGKRRRNYPTHDDITDDLMNKKNDNPQLYTRLYELIRSVYDCQEVLGQEIGQINFDKGFSVELLIKTIKWLFIEQDIRYWNYSGRDMLWCSIPHP